MPYITSANVACGGHAGDPSVMSKTIQLAKAHRVAVGAHPGYPDLQGFGRRAISYTPREVMHIILAQVGALWALARAEGVELAHVKPHGALYNRASTDSALAEAVARAVRLFSNALVLFCLPGSALETAAQSEGILVAREGFTDRAYEPNGLLADRSLPGAVHEDPQRAVTQALQLAEGYVICNDGSRIALQVDTLCLHGDTPGAPEYARLINQALLEAGFLITPHHTHHGAHK